ncbi:hypothetical protein Tco_1100809, partial [Tanacetum coccineum]
MKILPSLSLHFLSPIEDSDSLIEEIDIFLHGDGSIPPGIESDDFDSEDDDNSTSRLEFKSFDVAIIPIREIQPLMWNEYLRKGRKTKPKRQNRTHNGKA